MNKRKFSTFLIFFVIIFSIGSYLYFMGNSKKKNSKDLINHEKSSDLSANSEKAEAITTNNDNFNSFNTLNNNVKTNPDKLIAHAGGEIFGLTYTNSLEALNRSYAKGFRYFELDFKFTKDNKLVLIHDWEDSIDTLYEIEPQFLTHEEFKNLPTALNLTMLDLDDLILWLDENEDTFIITDTEDDNLEVLTYIQSQYPEYIHRFIPQIYKFEQYDPVYNLGFERIILTLYMCDNTDDEIVEFIDNNVLFGVAIEHSSAYDWLTVRIGELGKTRIYAHTINSLKPYRVLKSSGLYGLYTDHLEINNFVD